MGLEAPPLPSCVVRGDVIASWLIRVAKQLVSFCIAKWNLLIQAMWNAMCVPKEYYMTLSDAPAVKIGPIKSAFICMECRKEMLNV